MSTIEYGINPKDSDFEKLGTIVGYESFPPIHLTEQAHVSNYGTDGGVRYYANGVDDSGNRYKIAWDTTPAWDAACEALRNGEEPAEDAPDVEDESNVCDWNEPADITLTHSADEE